MEDANSPNRHRKKKGRRGEKKFSKRSGKYDIVVIDGGHGELQEESKDQKESDMKAASELPFTVGVMEQIKWAIKTFSAYANKAGKQVNASPADVRLISCYVGRGVKSGADRNSNNATGLADSLRRTVRAYRGLIDWDTTRSPPTTGKNGAAAPTTNVLPKNL